MPNHSQDLLIEFTNWYKMETSSNLAHAQTYTGKYTTSGNSKRMCRLSLPWLGRTSASKLATGCADLHLNGKSIQVAGLQVYSSRAFELASKTFAGTETRHDTARGNTSHFIIAVPCNKVAVVNNVHLVLNKLEGNVCQSRLGVFGSEGAYIFLDNRAKALHPQQPRACDVIDKETFSREETFDKTLRFVLMVHTAGMC